MRRLMILPAIVILLGGCALFAPPPEDTTALLLATEKLDAAKTSMADVSARRGKVFRDELLSRALGEIEQARLDELHSLATATKIVTVTIAADGTKTETTTTEPGTLDPAKVDAINAEAKKRTDIAIAKVMTAYEDTLNLAAEKDFNALYDSLRLYWMTRLNGDQQRQALADGLKDLLGVKTEGK